tara:strand:+ start:142 stop:735 length:594 start_codon:yes stop_codon:yes gene_type:complete
MATLKPFRDYDEKDVLNLYSLYTTGLDSTQDLSTWAKRLPHGTMVSVQTGWDTSQELEMLGDAGDASSALKNVTTQRYGVVAKVFPSADTERPLGMTLHHVASYDENGEQLKFNPRKAAELEACIPGQAIPIVRRGMFLINGVLGTPAAGGALYAVDNGGISATDGGSSVQIGIALGAAVTEADSSKTVLMLLDLQN